MKGCVLLILLLPVVAFSGRLDVLSRPLPAGLRQPPITDVTFQMYNAFYKKYVDGGCVPIISSARVQDAALSEARYIIKGMVGGNKALCNKLRVSKLRVGIMATSELTTDVPEHRYLASTPERKKYWDNRARGLGGYPTVTGAEENLLNCPGDRYYRENILVHEFSHQVFPLSHKPPYANYTSDLDKRLQAIYNDAVVKKRLWYTKEGEKSYAATNTSEYWAEGVQSYFDANDIPVANPNSPEKDLVIATREDLRAYDPQLYQLIAEVFKTTWRYSRPPGLKTRSLCKRIKRKA